MFANKPKFSVKTITVAGTVSSLAALVLVLTSVFYTYRLTLEKSREEEQISALYDMCGDFLDTSDFFTEQSRSFIIDYDINKMQGYWTEATTMKTIENCCATAEAYDFTDTEMLLIYNARDNIYALREIEMEAMALVASACKYDRSVLPDEIQQYKLTASQKSLTAEEKIYEARLLLYGDKYVSLNEIIDVDIESFRDIVDVKADEVGRNNRAKLNLAVSVQIVGTVIIFVMNVFSTYIYKVMVADPIKRNAKRADISGDIPLDISGFSEISEIANRYNENIGTKKEKKNDK